MLEWDKKIIGFVRRQAHGILWACPVHEVEDLVQEGWLVFNRLSKSHGRAKLEERHGKLDDQQCRAAWMALFKVSLRNRYRNIVRSATRRVWLRPMSEMVVRSRSHLDKDFELGFEDERRPFRAMEILCDLEQAPAIRQILETASWEDGVARIRRPRKLRCGKMETRADVLQRLVGRRAVGDFDAQLSMVV